jgi:inhibitor of KinA
MVPPTYPRILPVGEAAFTVEFGETVDAILNRRVHALDAALQAHPIPGVIETVPTYRSLLVMIDPRQCSADAVRKALERALAGAMSAAALKGRLVEIPVRYGDPWGPDLTDVAAHCGVTPADVIRLHSESVYDVAMLGFAPGFAYLLGLPSALATPRLATPRLRVPPGSVGIASAQTGIYALETPGGWRIIGRATLTMFDPHRDDPFVLHAGDRVRFMPW